MDSLIAAAARALGGSPRSPAAAMTTLEALADRANAQQARLIAARRLLQLGRLDEAASALTRVDTLSLPPLLTAVAELAAAELTLRSLRTGLAQAALARPAWRPHRCPPCPFCDPTSWSSHATPPILRCCDNRWKSPALPRARRHNLWP